MYNDEPIRTTGGPNFDERMRDSEVQRNLHPYGEPIRTTGGPSFDERVRNDEAQRNLNPYGEPIRTTGGPNFDERMRDSEAQRNLHPYGEPIRTTGGPSFDERVRNDEAQRMASIERNKEKVATLENLMKEFPSNSSDLIVILESLDYRLDFMKKLVEGYRDQFIDLASKLKGNYSQEASDLINNKLAEYICLIETLKTAGYNFGSEMDSYTNNFGYYDPNKPDLQLQEIMSTMHVRRKNGADVDIIFPVNYDFADQEYQPKCDAVTVINNVNEHLKNNPYMAAIWKKSGYTFPNDEMKRAM